MSETRPPWALSTTVASTSDAFPPILPSPAGAPPKSGRVWSVRRSRPAPLPYWPFAALIIALGVLLRVRQWWFARSFWGDELYVVHNLRDRGYLDLLEPLAFSQTAPPGWLWLERLSLQLFGASEHSLRLVPLLFGLALLPLVGYFGRRLMPPPSALAALLLVAIAPFLVGYSNELKQYSADAFCVTLLVGIALLLSRRELTWRGGVVFWATSLAVLVLSTLAIPVVAALTALLVVHALARPGRDREERLRELVRFVAPAPAWIVVAVWVYVRLLGPGLSDPQLKAYWQGKSIYPAHPLSDVPATVDWIGATYRTLATVPFVVWSVWVAVPLVVVGAVLCWRRLNPLAVFILLAPLAVGLGGAALSIYPFNGRLALYAVPSWLMLAGFAVASPRARQPVLGWVGWGAGAALVVAVAVPQLAMDVVVTANPARAFHQGGGANVADYRSALRHLSAELRPGDLVLATPVSWNAQAYYGPPPDGYVVPAEPAGCAGQPVSTLLAGRSRVWLFQATDWDEPQNRDLIVRLGSGGAAVTERTFRGARVVRFDLTGTAAVGDDVCLVPPPRGGGVR
ncbi:glycosyltransferase family 39 protein [Micromonospora musae]|uniref:glycosyltransferase family 39 protein n=1 Tax=Micromonospora musae TaxID=1894970 RepID=UPI001F2B4C7A|nr:glycosyltransferase family 39 protein [Micromonospora musae]